MTKTVSYSEMLTMLDDWAGYHDRFNATIQSVYCGLVDAWGRLPEPYTARRAADLVRKYHGGAPELCPRATALLACLDSIQ